MAFITFRSYTPVSSEGRGATEGTQFKLIVYNKVKFLCFIRGRGILFKKYLKKRNYFYLQLKYNILFKTLKFKKLINS